MKEDINKKIKDKEKASVTQTTAGGPLAAAYAYTTSGVELLQDLDALVVALANIDFSDIPGCKNIDTTQGEEDDSNVVQDIANFTIDAVNAIPGCSPLAEAISVAINDPSPQNVAEATLKTISQLVGDESRFPACVVEQFRQFLSVLPVQYYLLVSLSSLAKSVAKKGEAIQKEIQTPCGTSLQEIETFENRFPQFDIPLIPKIPYINIPDLSDLPMKILYEAICITVCAITSPIIKRVSSFFLNVEDSWTETLLGEDGKTIQPLVKIPINPYISDQAILEAKERKLIPANVTNKQVRDYLDVIQSRDDVTQQEFIFLFLGQTSCNIILKIQDLPETVKVFKLDNDQKIINFFAFLGSFIGFIGLIEDSRAKVCDPDPCDLRPEEVQDTLQQISNLCQLLNPNLTVPTIPLGAIMDATGANDFISDSTYENFRNLGSLFARKQFYLQDNNEKTYLPIEPFIAAQVNATRIVSDSLTGSLPLINQLQRKQQNFLSVVFPFMLNQITFAYPDKDFTTKIITGPTPSVFSNVKKLPPNDSYPDGADDGGQPYFSKDSKTAIGARTQAVRYEKYTKDEIKERFQLLQKNTSTASEDDARGNFRQLKKEFKL